MSDQKYNSPEDPYFEDAQADEFEEEELISKTELKRQAKELHKLGETLVNLSDAHIATIPMDEELADAIAIARKRTHQQHCHWQLLLLCNTQTPAAAAMRPSLWWWRSVLSGM